MKMFTSLFKCAATVGLLLFIFTGCGTTDGGGSVSGGVYYGVGFYDPWYHGGYYDGPDYIVTPPDRPAVSPRPTPLPSIPSTPRAAPRGGGGRR